MRKLLIPVDGSAAAQRALQYALALKAQDEALEISLLNVQQPTLYASLVEGINTQLSMQHMLLEQGEAILDFHGQTLREKGIAFTQSIKIGKAADVICEQAKQANVQHIIMGAHGSHVGSYIFGSVAYPVVIHSPVPVTLIK